MTRKNIICFTFLAAIFFAAAVEAQEGQTLFLRKCAMCHAPTGKGQSWLIKKVGQDRASIVDATREKTDKELRNIIKTGSGEMKGVRVEDDEETQTIIDYIRQLKLE